MPKIWLFIKKISRNAYKMPKSFETNLGVQDENRQNQSLPGWRPSYACSGIWERNWSDNHGREIHSGRIFRQSWKTIKVYKIHS